MASRATVIAVDLYRVMPGAPPYSSTLTAEQNGPHWKFCWIIAQYLDRIGDWKAAL